MNLIITFPFLLSLFLLIKNRNNQAVSLFNLTILGLSIYVMAHYFTNSEDSSFIATFLFNHFTPLYLMIGPFFYLFVLIKLNIIIKLRRIDLLHFIPSLIQLISIIPYFFMPWTEKVNLVKEIYINPEVQEFLNVNLFFTPKFNYIFRFLHFMSYCIISSRLIQLKIKTTPPDNKVQLISLKKITTIFILLTVIYFIHIIVILVGGIYKTTFLNIIIYLDVILFVVLIFEIFKYPELLFSNAKFKRSYIQNSPFYLREVNKNLIPQSTYVNIEAKINNMKKNRDLLIDPDTNFDVFANEINENKYHIRLFLNYNDLTFMKLKNEIRVEEAIKYLESEDRLKLDYIAKKSGFNSPSNFYKIFRKITGYTPSEYENKYPKTN